MSLDKPNPTDAFTPLTSEEKRAIASLRRLANSWPDSLWLFAAAGSLCVMKKGPDGNRIVIPGNAGANSPGGGMDPDAQVASIDIECDGGDW